MSGRIRLPNITGRTPEEQMQQMKSYLIQMAGELNWAMENIAGESTSPTPNRSVTVAGPGVQKKEEELLKNFNDLKGLIIKSADIVNAYYEEINTRLEGLYVAQSEYGAFVEKTEAKTTENSTGIATNYSNIQLVEENIVSTKDELNTSIADTEIALQGNIDTVETNLNKNITDTKEVLNQNIANTESSLAANISATKTDLEGSIHDAEDRLKELINSATAILVEVQAYIKSGLLYYDDSGIPIYGVEVGQTNLVNGQEIFNKYARFTSDRLSFFDQNGGEVAYISDRKLFISNVEITVSFKIGGFVDTVMGDKSIVTKWVGGR